MTYSDLSKWRKRVPFVIFGICILPSFFFKSRNLAATKLANDLLVPILATIAAFFYLGLGFGRSRWEKETDTYLGRQIREGIIGLVPGDLMVTAAEKQDLEREIFKDLSGVFWEAVDQDDLLKSQKQYFYSNGIIYSTSIDAYLICSLAAFIYTLSSILILTPYAPFLAISFEPILAYFAGAFLAIALTSYFLVTPRIRSRHMRLSVQQLDLLRRRQLEFVS